jgi:hypothetical protein
MELVRLRRVRRKINGAEKAERRLIGLPAVRECAVEGM